MSYVSPNFTTKKALKQALKDGEEVVIFQPGGLFPMAPGPGTSTVEGPHYPKPHRWYARVEYNSDLLVTKVVG